MTGGLRFPFLPLLAGAVAVVVSNPAGAECSHPWDHDKNEPMETDGYSYTYGQTKGPLPAGSVLASRQALLDAGVTAPWFDAHFTLGTGSVEWVYPDCTSWTTVQIGWTLTVGDWTAVVVGSSRLEGDVAVPDGSSPATLHDVEQTLPASEAVELLATCGPAVPAATATFCDSPLSLCVWGLDAHGGPLGWVNLETGKVHCTGDSGDISKGGPGESGAKPVGIPTGPGAASESPTGAESDEPSSSGCATRPTSAPRIPLWILLVALVLVRGRLSTRSER